MKRLKGLLCLALLLPLWAGVCPDEQAPPSSAGAPWESAEGDDSPSLSSAQKKATKLAKYLKSTSTLAGLQESHPYRNELLLALAQGAAMLLDIKGTAQFATNPLCQYQSEGNEWHSERLPNFLAIAEQVDSLAISEKERGIENLTYILGKKCEHDLANLCPSQYDEDAKFYNTPKRKGLNLKHDKANEVLDFAKKLIERADSQLIALELKNKWIKWTQDPEKFYRIVMGETKEEEGFHFHQGERFNRILKLVDPSCDKDKAISLKWKKKHKKFKKEVARINKGSEAKEGLLEPRMEIVEAERKEAPALTESERLRNARAKEQACLSDAQCFVEMFLVLQEDKSREEIAGKFLQANAKSNMSIIDKAHKALLAKFTVGSSEQVNASKNFKIAILGSIFSDDMANILKDNEDDQGYKLVDLVGEWKPICIIGSMQPMMGYAMQLLTKQYEEDKNNSVVHFDEAKSKILYQTFLITYLPLLDELADPKYRKKSLSDFDVRLRDIQAAKSRLSPLFHEKLIEDILAGIK